MIITNPLNLSGCCFASVVKMAGHREGSVTASWQPLTIVMSVCLEGTLLWLSSYLPRPFFSKQHFLRVQQGVPGVLLVYQPVVPGHQNRGRKLPSKTHQQVSRWFCKQTLFCYDFVCRVYLFYALITGTLQISFPISNSSSLPWSWVARILFLSLESTLRLFGHGVKTIRWGLEGLMTKVFKLCGCSV